jgi:hypothetical protein
MSATQPGDRFPGKGKTIADACDDAWKNRGRKPGDPAEYELKVLELYAFGTNPITGYRVVLGPAA